MPRSPLTETYKRVQGMVFYVQENLSADEYMLFLDMVDPQPEPAPAKKTRKKRTTKSAKAQSLSTAITTSREAKANPDKHDRPCVYQYPDNGDITPGKICGCPLEDTIHDESMGYAGYHPFDAPAQAAEKKSRRKAAATGSTQNTETPAGAAMSAGG